MSSDEQQPLQIFNDDNSINIEYLRHETPNFDDFEHLITHHTSKFTEKYDFNPGFNTMYKLVCKWLVDNELSNWAEAYLEATIIAKTITEFYMLPGNKQNVKTANGWKKIFVDNPKFSQKITDHYNNLKLMGEVSTSMLYDLQLQFLSVDPTCPPKYFLNAIDETN